MTRKEIHIRSVLKKNGFIWNQGLVGFFDKSKWKYVESHKKNTYVHVVLHLSKDLTKVYATFFTDFTFKDVKELDKYIVVYNRVKGIVNELGLELC